MRDKGVLIRYCRPEGYCVFKRGEHLRRTMVQTEYGRDRIPPTCRSARTGGREMRKYDFKFPPIGVKLA